MTDIRTKVEIADMTGHTTVQLTKEETLEQVQEHPAHWIFVNDRMVNAQELEQANWAQVDGVRMVPGLVGGL